MRIDKEQRVLVLAPHCDDAELGMGGMIARLTAAGAEVHVMIFATGTVFFKHLDRVVTEDERRAEGRTALLSLGVGTVEFPFNEKDRYLDNMPIVDLIRRIDEKMGDFKPTQVYIPLPSSHNDHSVLYTASMSACRPSAYSKDVQFIAGYEYTASSWYSMSAGLGRGGIYVDISGEWLQRKLVSLRLHKSQIRESGHCWSTEAAETMGRFRGMECGREYAELLHPLRGIL